MKKAIMIAGIVILWLSTGYIGAGFMQRDWRNHFNEVAGSPAKYFIIIGPFELGSGPLNSLLFGKDMKWENPLPELF